MKKSWQEKLKESKDLPKVVVLGEHGQVHWGGKTMAVPSPMEVNEIMAGVPHGKLITTNVIRQRIAAKHNADIGCPLTSGIFSWIAAHAAEEQKLSGAEKFTPWWRTLKSDGTLNEKYPGGAENQAALLEQEGHVIVRKGKQLRVARFEDLLVEV